jgi:hypothetical protein
MSSHPVPSPKSDLEVEREEKVGGAPLAQVSTTYGEEPELHFKTWLALISMAIVQYVSLMALVGPPTVVSISLFIVYCNSTMTR